ncbi:MAG: MotA/TolQ/ExbB proton channel family protein [Firmicutes bacterium]|nr:MotA/TolQ/ExbB proton channel family protein [Bacillota bacterium]
MWQFFVKGGLAMYPLTVCSILALIIIIERILFFSRIPNDDPEYQTLKKLLSQGKINEAKVLSDRWNSAISRVTASAVKQWEADKRLLESAIQSAGETELNHLQRGLSILDTIVTASPLLGLLGTVTGIIKTFLALSASNGQAAQLSAGIAEALYTTAFGLSIAIPALFFVNIFYGIAEKRALDLNSKCREIITILQEG